MNTLVRITEQTQQFSERTQQDVLDFVEFFRTKCARSVVQPDVPQRPASLHVGLVVVTDDFDVPLDDAFWCGSHEVTPRYSCIFMTSYF